MINSILHKLISSYLCCMLIVVFQACHKDTKSASAPVVDENSLELTEDQMRRLDITLVSPEKKALESYIHFNG